MASESDRVTKNKRVKLPSGGEVLFPVIARISFTDQSDRYQESQSTIDNTGQSDRTVHIAWVGSSGTEDAPPGPAPSGLLAVERIDVWKVLDNSDRGQETFTTLDNKTKDENGPPYFITHLKTHVLRIVNNPDNGMWIETEVIDQFSFLDASDRNQETIYNLENPAGEPDGQGHLLYSARSDDQEMASGDGVDPPWRTDPFQNIVKFKSGLEPGKETLFVSITATLGFDFGGGGPTVTLNESVGASGTHVTETTYSGLGSPQSSDANSPFHYIFTLYNKTTSLPKIDGATAVVVGTAGAFSITANFQYPEGTTVDTFTFNAAGITATDPIVAPRTFATYASLDRSALYNAPSLGVWLQTSAGHPPDQPPGIP